MDARHPLAAAVIGMCLGGCVVGPNYQAPAQPMPGAFDLGQGPAATQPATQPATRNPANIDRWWTALDDPQLDSLVREAVLNNFDLKAALMRLQEARIGEYIVSGGALPLVDVSAGAGRGTGSDSTRGRVGAPLHSAANTKGYKEITEVAGFDATWEIDLFGHFSREIEAARADTQAAAEARNAVLITVVADVARAYVNERALQLRLAVARQNLKIQRQSVQLVTTRFNRGITNELDVALARRELATLESTLAPLKAALADAQRRIAMLIGRMPQNISAAIENSGHLPLPPKAIAPGMPVDLLRRRPDIRQAERELAASTARIGVATANLYPRVALTGAFGFQGQGLGQTPVLDKTIWSFGPAAYWPVLDFGVLDSVVQEQDLRTRELLFKYRQTILRAVEEVDGAITNYNARREQVDRLNDAVTASERAVTLATQRYERGLTDFLNVLDAQRQLYGLQDQQAVAQEEMVLQYIAIYKALGGGWQNDQRIPNIRRPQPAVIAAGREAIRPTKQPGQ